MTEAIDNATWLPKALEDSAVYAQTRFSEKPEGRKFSIPEGANLAEADLRGADLTGANLYGARLNGSIGNRREIISIQTRKYATIYTDEILQIGCKQYPIDEWWGFDDATIAAMDLGALEWWKTHKPLLQALIAANPATPTGHKSKPDSSESGPKQ